MGHKYKITYVVKHHKDGLTKEDLHTQGACDNFFMMSIMGTPCSRALSVSTASMRGEDGKEMAPAQLFQLWCLWATELAESPTLGNNSRELCQLVVDAVRRALHAVKRAERE